MEKMASGGVWALYTAHQHKFRNETREAVGIITGGSTSDTSVGCPPAEREQPFSDDLFAKCLDIKVKDTGVSYDIDRNRILNVILGKRKFLTNEPSKHHKAYDKLDDALKSRLIASIPALQAFFRNDKTKYQECLKLFSKSGIKSRISLNFKEGMGWDEWSIDDIIHLIKHLPPTIEEIRICCAPYGPAFMNAVIEWMKTTVNLRIVVIELTCVGGENGEARYIGARLAKILAKKDKVTHIWLEVTDLIGSRNALKWSKALRKMSHLKVLDIAGYGNRLLKIDHDTIDKHSVKDPGDERQSLLLKNRVFPKCDAFKFWLSNHS